MSDSIISNNKQCLVCGTTINLHKHHVFGGANRKISDRDGCWCWLCGEHHNLSGWGVHFNKVLDEALKRRTQTLWEERYGNREAFRERYGKSWL